MDRVSTPTLSICRAPEYRYRANGLRPEAHGLTDGINLLRAVADEDAPDGTETVTEWGVQWTNADYGEPDWFAYSERAHAEAVLADGDTAGHVVTRTTTRTPWRPADGFTP